MLTVPQKIAGLTTFCYGRYLDSFLLEQNKTAKQPFEIYEGPPEFLPANSPIFLFQVDEERKPIRMQTHRLRAIARFIGYLTVNGWKKPGEIVADQLLNLYKKEGFVSHDTREELETFCEKKRGIRGLFIFDRIIEIKYSSKEDWIKKGHVADLFMGKQPYAQGFPFRYLTEEMVGKLMSMILKKAENSKEIRGFLEKNIA